VGSVEEGSGIGFLYVVPGATTVRIFIRQRMDFINFMLLISHQREQITLLISRLLEQEKCLHDRAIFKIVSELEFAGHITDSNKG
jgi:hypothetical protein